MKLCMSLLFTSWCNLPRLHPLFSLISFTKRVWRISIDFQACWAVECTLNHRYFRWKMFWKFSSGVHLNYSQTSIGKRVAFTKFNFLLLFWYWKQFSSSPAPKNCLRIQMSPRAKASSIKEDCLAYFYIKRSPATCSSVKPNSDCFGR